MGVEADTVSLVSLSNFLAISTKLKYLIFSMIFQWHQIFYCRMNLCIMEPFKNDVTAKMPHCQY